MHEKHSRMNRIFYGLVAVLIFLSACNTTAQQLTIADNGQSMYKIVLPAEPSKQEQKCAAILQDYINRVSGTKLAIVKEEKRMSAPGIYVGQTAKAEDLSLKKKMAPESSLLHANGKDLIICSGNGKGLTYGVYGFIERYLGCKKISNDPAIVQQMRSINISGKLHEERRPSLVYREVYYPAAHDAEYLEWNQLQSLEDLWGFWGHSYNKLVPAQTYFKTHPEYYALVKGRRQATQLCLSNEEVYKIVVSDLKKRMADNPDAMYWSISPNDDNGYCTCNQCSAVDNEQGSPAGSLIKFVNRVAKAFPDKQFTTLAYAYTHKAPRNLKPAANVYVFLSNIDAFRDKPLSVEGSAGSFRSDLKAWAGLTPNLFVWDYVTQFTNYLAPFPNFHTLQPNMQYMMDNGIKGMFVQGSGDTYGEWAELRSYVLAKLMQDNKADVKKLTADFMKAYYGNAAKYLQQYLDMVQDRMIASKRKLDIYGNPINAWNSWLTPELLDQYSTLFDKAEGAVEENPVYAERVMRARLPLEYTVYQQARFYGIEKYGIFVNNGGKWSVRPKMEERIARFVANCKKAKVTEMSEGGPNPDKYMEEWNAIFKGGVTPSKAVGASVTLQNPFVEDWPAKGNRTLTDGNPGYNDFSYNWLCFYGVPMVATIDLGKAQSVTKVKMHFLDDPRHWIFMPENVKVEVSADGSKYTQIASVKGGAGEEHYDVALREVNAQYRTTQASPVRYIRVTATNLSSLPEWRYRDGKKPMIACDEIWVQ